MCMYVSGACMRQLPTQAILKRNCLLQSFLHSVRLSLVVLDKLGIAVISVEMNTKGKREKEGEERERVASMLPEVFQMVFEGRIFGK